MVLILRRGVYGAVFCHCALMKTQQEIELGIRMRIRSSREAHGKFEMAKLEALARQCCAVLRLSVHNSASEVNRSSGDTQVVSRHRYLVIFHPFVEQLTVFHTSGLVLVSSSVL